jgi:signal transduction histidine kinase
MALSSNKMTDKIVDIIGDPYKYEFQLDDIKDSHPIKQVISRESMLITDDIEQYLSPYIAKDKIKSIKRNIDIKSVAIYPIKRKGEISGILSYFLSTNDSESFDRSQKQLLSTFTQQITIALENAELYRNSKVIQAELKNSLDEVQRLRQQERDMIDVMGHELRTPITIVRNALDVLDALRKSTGTIPEKMLEEYLEMALESTRREMSLIETLLSATKLDSERIQISKEKVDMVDVVHDSLAAHRSHAQKKGLDINYDKPDNEVYAYADRVRTQEIMDNFMSNAIKYTEEGSITIQINEVEEMIEIKVIDTGIGISEEDLDKLGQKFFRAKQYIDDNSNDEETIVRPGGTGLGLYVVFNLIDRMNGELILESKLGEGSTFGFRLPKYAGQKQVKYEESKSLKSSSPLVTKEDYEKIKNETQSH